MSLAFASRRTAPRRHRLRRVLTEAGAATLGLALLVWSLAPIYQMFLIALDPEEGEIEFTGNMWPYGASLDGFHDVVTQEARYLEDFWRQFGNSLEIGVATMVLTVLITSLASFAVGRMRLGRSGFLTNTALLTYALPASFLVIPFYKIMSGYGLADNPWAVIAAQVTFASPFAILILQHYGKLLPLEIDDSARLDGASALQLYLRIYLPLMAPALGIVAIYALLLAWNDYLYQFVLLTSARHLTVAGMQSDLFTDIDAPWNAMMAAAILYALPPIAIFCALYRYVVRGLVLGEAKD
jgi:multiple sugar transport system permease protein